MGVRRIGEGPLRSGPSGGENRAGCQESIEYNWSRRPLKSEVKAKPRPAPDGGELNLEL